MAVASRSSRLGAARNYGVFGVPCRFVAARLVGALANVTPQPGGSMAELLTRTPTWWISAAPIALCALPQHLTLKRGG